MDVQPLIDVLRPIATVFGLLASILSSIGTIINMLGRLRKQVPPLHIYHPRVLVGAFVALLIVGLSFIVLNAPIALPVDTRYLVANGVAIVGLVISIGTWMIALTIAVRLPGLARVVWFVGLLLGGALLYLPAILEGDFLSYFLMNAIPAVFGVFGPQLPKK